MTPGARVQAAIEVLDRIAEGAAAEQALTRWARQSRFAGSKDRAAIRDHVFDALRCKRRFAAGGGGGSGRALMLGAARMRGDDPDTIFTGQGYAPAPLTDAERAAGRAPDPGAEAADMPDWLWPELQASLGDRLPAVAAALQERAPVHLRVNAMKADLATAQKQLLDEGLQTRRHEAASMALEVTDGARRLRQCAAYEAGVVELQDAGSQAVVDRLPLQDGMRVLDYCAGGGGKSLAMAARARLTLFAHDAAPQRMNDLPKRAAKAGITCQRVATDALPGLAPFDLVLCDVPCSGSGAWRRSPDGKWRLTRDGLDALLATQREILHAASSLVIEQGWLAYATCSLLDAENIAQIERFLSATPGWALQGQFQWLPDHGTDGLYCAILTRE